MVDTLNGTLCALEIPTTEVYFGHTLQTATGITQLSVYIIITLVVWGLYIEESVYLMKVMTRPCDLSRRGITLWILGLFPAFASAGLFGYVVPRSACICDLAANVYMALCLYAVLLLMINYMGGLGRIGAVVKHYSPVTVHANTLPLCCCCVCLPSFVLTRETFMRMRSLVLQCAVLRPLVMFTMAVFWTNDWYHHGELVPTSAGFYLNIINILSTVTGVWGINVCKSAFGEILAEFRIAQKLLVVMGVLLSTLFIPIIIGIVITAGGVPCERYTTARGAGDAIYRGILICLMLVFSVLGRFLFRNAEDVHQLHVLDEIQIQNKNQLRDSQEFGTVISDVTIDMTEDARKVAPSGGDTETKLSPSGDDKVNQTQTPHNGATPGDQNENVSEQEAEVTPTPETPV